MGGKAQWHKGCFDEPRSACGEWMFSLNMANDLQLHTCQTHSSIVPRSRGWGRREESTARRGKAGGPTAVFCLLWLRHVNLWSWSLFRNGWMKVVSFPLDVWTFPLPLTSLGIKGAPESTHCLKPLSTPFLGTPREDCCRNSVGQCPQDTADPCRLPLSSSHSSWSPKTRAKHRGTGEGFCRAPTSVRRQSVTLGPALQYGQPASRNMRLPFAFELPATKITADGFQSWLSFGFPPSNQNIPAAYFCSSIYTILLTESQPFQQYIPEDLKTDTLVLFVSFFLWMFWPIVLSFSPNK